MLKLWFVAAVAGAALPAGCQEDDRTMRQEGDLATSPEDVYQSPTSPIPGQTTGGGLPVDRRTGGGVDGGDLTPPDQMRAWETVPPPATQPAQP